MKHNTTQHNTTQHNTTQHNTTQHLTEQSSTQNAYQRTADENIYTEKEVPVKEHFKQVAGLLSLDMQKHDNTISLIDIGGATGAFLHYVRTLQPDMQLVCAEYSPRLIEAGEKLCSAKNITFIEADANNLQEIKDHSFDFVTTLGVTSIFDDFRPSFEEMIRVAKPGARCLNSMLVNESDIDVIIKYIHPVTKLPESGWNKFSLKSIENFLKSHPLVGNYSFVKHVMPFDLPQGNDLMRSWTKFNEKGERILWNGLNMEISIYHILFERR